MNRRLFIASLFSSAAVLYTNRLTQSQLETVFVPHSIPEVKLSSISTQQLMLLESAIEDNENIAIATLNRLVNKNAKDISIISNNAIAPSPIRETNQNVIQDVSSNSSVNARVKNFNTEFLDDLHASAHEMALIRSIAKRLKRIQKVIGFGNFNLISFDQAISYAKNFDRIGRFSKGELNYIDKLFNTEASLYGFYGKKISSSLTETIRKKETVKIAYSGHSLFKGESLDYYNRLVADMGPSIILTSGIRSNIKQLGLFLNKCIITKGNLSQASRSLAPPGHSYHGIGDFDVGKVGFGLKNFSSEFSSTVEFKKMQQLGYVKIRYTEDNQLGVRFEPWHIKVV